MKKLVNYLLILVALTVTAGCVTPYQALRHNGGYKETKIDDMTYHVSYKGDRAASEDKVWYYWIYRCAEFTKLQGYEKFMVYSDNQPLPPRSSSLDNLNMADKGNSQDSDGLLPAKGGGNYVYVPTYTTVTIYTASGLLRFLKDPTLSGATYIQAQQVLDEVKPYVESNGKTKMPLRFAFLQQVMAKAETNRPSVLVPSSSKGTSYQDYRKLMEQEQK